MKRAFKFSIFFFFLLISNKLYQEFKQDSGTGNSFRPVPTSTLDNKTVGNTHLRESEVKAAASRNKRRLYLLLLHYGFVSKWSGAGAASGRPASARSHTHTPPGCTSVSVFASSFSRQFTSVNMCADPRAHVLRAFDWLSSRLRRTPLVDTSSQWLLYSPLIGRRFGHSRSCPLMCRPCARCRAELLYYSKRV